MIFLLLVLLLVFQLCGLVQIIFADPLFRYTSGFSLGGWLKGWWLVAWYLSFILSITICNVWL